MSETSLPTDFVPDDDFEDEHGPDHTGGPGGVANSPHPYVDGLKPQDTVV